MLGKNGSRLPNGRMVEGRVDDEGGLRAPPHLTGWRKAWWWFDFIVLVKLARLRFIMVLAAIGVVITQWDTLVAHYDKWTRPAAVSQSGGSDVEYFCPMHPTIVRDNPKEKCPICFMPLSKRKKGDSTEEALPAGVVNRVQLSPYRVVLAGVNTTRVDYQPLVKEINIVGYIEFDEREQRTVAARVNGRIDELLVNQTGQLVEKGEALAALYSPEVIVSMQNLLDAKKAGNEGLEQSARRRLSLLGIEEDQIHDCIKDGQVRTHVHIRSPIRGHVIKKYVNEGQYVTEGMRLYDVADLSTVWIQSQVHEDDLAFLPLAMSQTRDQTALNAVSVTATTRTFPDEVFHGKLSFIYPHVDQATRTATVRFELANPEHKLRPGSTANVTMQVSLPNLAFARDAFKDDPAATDMLAEGKILAVPEGSVIDTGRQRIIYRQSSPGVFDGVQVALGPAMVGPHGARYFPVLRGLQAGEHVVTAGSFLVDAETRLNPAAGSIYFGGNSGSGGKSAASAVRPSTPEDENATVEMALAELSEEDRKLALEQQFCPVLEDSRLGSMGTPVKVVIEGQPVFLCCPGCKKQALANPQETLAALRGRDKSPAAPRPRPAAASADAEDGATAALDELPEPDRELARAQGYCPISPDSQLGSMGPPVKIMIQGTPVFLCCEGCTKKALADPAKTLARLKEVQEKNRLRR